MAARKDDSPKQAGNDRRAVIWRLPASRGGNDSAGAGAAPAPGRRVPRAAVWGLAAALVLLGLYAAWSEFGDDIRGTGDEPAVAALPVETAPAAGRAGEGAAGAGAAAPVAAADGGGVRPGVVVDEAPPADGDTRAAALADTEKGSETGQASEAAPAAAAQDPAAAARDSVEPAPPAEDAVPAQASPPVDPPAPAPAEGARRTAPSAAAAAAEGTAAAEGGGTVAATTADPLALGALAARVSALESDAARLELDRALAAWGEQRAALETALAAMSRRLAQVEAERARHAAADGRLMTLVLATGELTGALASSAGFASTLETLRGIAGDDPEIAAAIERLEPFAGSGVVTLDGLRARYPEAANAVVRAAPAADDADWIDETVTRLSQLVTVRRTGGALDPKSIDGRLVEAETALAAGDLAQAIALVEPLAPDAAEASSAHAWLHDARARREADAALAELAATLRARIGARWAATGAAQ